MAATLQVVIRNDTPTKLIFSKSIKWSGGRQEPSPAHINVGNSSSFTLLLGGKTEGSKGAVVYFGTNLQGDPSGWLLAWHAPSKPSPSNPNRVHGEAGDASLFRNIDWDAIESKLDARLGSYGVESELLEARVPSSGILEAALVRNLDARVEIPSPGINTVIATISEGANNTVNLNAAFVGF